MTTLAGGLSTIGMDRSDVNAVLMDSLNNRNWQALKGARVYFETATKNCATASRWSEDRQAVEDVVKCYWGHMKVDGIGGHRRHLRPRIPNFRPPPIFMRGLHPHALKLWSQLLARGRRC